MGALVIITLAMVIGVSCHCDQSFVNIFLANYKFFIYLWSETTACASSDMTWSAQPTFVAAFYTFFPKSTPGSTLSRILFDLCCLTYAARSAKKQLIFFPIVKCVYVVRCTPPLAFAWQFQFCTLSAVSRGSHLVLQCDELRCNACAAIWLIVLQCEMWNVKCEMWNASSSDASAQQAARKKISPKQVFVNVLELCVLFSLFRRLELCNYVCRPQSPADHRLQFSLTIWIVSVLAPFFAVFHNFLC